jgi:hypothetical protein
MSRIRVLSLVLVAGGIVPFAAHADVTQKQTFTFGPATGGTASTPRCVSAVPGKVRVDVTFSPSGSDGMAKWGPELTLTGTNLANRVGGTRTGRVSPLQLEYDVNGSASALAQEVASVRVVPNGTTATGTVTITCPGYPAPQITAILDAGNVPIVESYASQPGTLATLVIVAGSFPDLDAIYLGSTSVKFTAMAKGYGVALPSRRPSGPLSIKVHNPGGEATRDLFILSHASTGKALGCFADNAVRDLTGASFTDKDMTNRRCVSLCGAKGHRYAGTENGNQCFCGETFGKYGASTACTMPCSGSASEKCGGFWASSINEVPPPPLSTAIGCYTDTATRDLSFATFEASDMTATRCATFCWQKGSVYAATQFGNSCFCGSSYGKYGASTACTTPCGGNPRGSRVACGGVWANSIVQISNTPMGPSGPENESATSQR